jgi:hypothetical protein
MMSFSLIVEDRATTSVTASCAQKAARSSSAIPEAPVNSLVYATLIIANVPFAIVGGVGPLVVGSLVAFHIDRAHSRVLPVMYE